MKICSYCKKRKKISSFNWRNKSKGIRSGTCRDCKREQQSNWYANNKSRHIRNVTNRNGLIRSELRQCLWDYLSENPCVDCGEDDLVVLDLDHRDPEDKKFIVSEIISRAATIGILKKELAKCDVRCANCHRRRTAKSQNWFKARN